MSISIKTLMTLVGAGSLLLMSVAVISAELSKTISTERQQVRPQDYFLNSPQDIDEESELAFCLPSGKVTRLQNSSLVDDKSLVAIPSASREKYVYSKVLCG